MADEKRLGSCSKPAGSRLKPEIVDLAPIPGQVLEVLARLEENGFRAYLVGGVVRDLILGREPKDYDIATSAAPDQVRELFPRVLPTGEKHGTVTVLYAGLALETTTLRREGRYSDYRRPDSVEFTGSLREDLSRRDFTINAMALGMNGVLYDFFGGLPDISRKIIRAVGNPRQRFGEDALRMIRAVRFACQLGFAIEKRTGACIRANRRLIARVSAERIREELNAILLSGEPDGGLDLLCSLGLLDFILPELASRAQVAPESGMGDVIGYTMEVLKNTPPKQSVRLAALLHCTGMRGQAGEIMDRLKYDRRTIRQVSVLVGELGIDQVHKPDEKEIKQLISRVGEHNLDDLADLLQARALAAGLPGGIARVENLKRSIKLVLEKNEPFRIKDLALNGNDLKAMGIKPGREMGDILNRLLEVVLERPRMNEKSRLVELVRQWINPPI